MDERPMLRGIFAFEDEETPEWRRVVMSETSGGVPKFATRAECEDFIRKHCWRGSNPSFPKLQHVFSMFVSWQQIEEVLSPKIDEYDLKFPPEPAPCISADNRFAHGEGLSITENVDYRVNLPFHQQTNRESTYNTLHYLFYHMRCGIFVMIRRRRVVIFAPFANKDYENNWGHNVTFDSSDGSMYTYYREKQRCYRRENIIQDVNKWWANGNIICNEHCRYRDREDETQYWGDQFLTQLRDMLENACNNRNIADCEFFINKRDYPHLKKNLSEPYGFLFDKDDRDPSDDIPLTRHLYATYAPVMSFYVSKRFADIPFPCSEDWEAATGLVFPQSFRHTHCDKCPCQNFVHCENDWECFCDVGANGRKRHGIESARDLFTANNFRKFFIPWENKVNTAFFRGSATGGGTTIDTNQRLHLAHLSTIWKKDPTMIWKAQSDSLDENSVDQELVPLLNAEVTTWNLRDKKIAGKPMTYLHSKNFVFEAGRQHFIPIYEQSKFKYILYVEGHCAANRYAFLMRLGSVILKVESRCVADEMWYFPILKPFEDHVPIKADLSDLAEKIKWCRDNDGRCQQIATCANELYQKFVSKEAIHDYVEVICNRVAQRFRATPKWYKRPECVNSIKKPDFGRCRGMCVGGSSARYCKRCQEMKESDDEARANREYERQTSRNNYGGFSYSSFGRDHGRKRNRSHGHDRSSHSHRREDRDRAERGYGGASIDYRGDNMCDRSRSPNRPRVQQCRKCRRAKSACQCSFRGT
ncbi:Endoplasmic reticulum protein EP58, contains filamin rod domain and KDEL motif [Plasmopara halstedii]|uniref:Endoplasmic reticulum protein EP58, contains filamin rod domain and KDEL motif n=1 Tax=Plasmopara halstedii TaxID=4781 RepID=A0A0P1A584_PLAHL|nr:Endoplasmic reticulum protein EP58, contains filamin rod domain and KDEL motif [Plasmopara halstedii]CEG35702.1 Endoplasmic reticulum protein EP58, contains filamin rod domain and KDEL motif [Plasmopara halstedii]|eukprot:XP_024572071.1 Endoplasmic reticulum protein EP58, contains filamin rod domain and KDEL motif [Plasmopara halstedii]